MLISAAGSSTAPLIAAFREGLSARGFQDGEMIRLVIVSAPGANQYDELVPRLPERPSAVVGATAPEVRWLMGRYPTTPVVMVAVGDPVGFGLVELLSRPGGHVTGLSDFKLEYSEMRLALARTFVPDLQRVGFIHNPDAPSAQHTFDAAQRLSIEIVPLVARTPSDLELALARVDAATIDALVAAPYPVTFGRRKAISERAAEQRIPLIFGYPEFMDQVAPAAGLASLGADLIDLYRRAADYVAKILAGADPAELEIGKPERDTLVINLGTARALGIKVPPDLLRRADRVIE